MLEIFPNAIFCSLECPSVERKYFFEYSIFVLKTAPAFGGNTFTRMNPGESCPQMLGNEALVPFPKPDMLGNEALGAVLMHILEKTLEKLLISEAFALPQCPNYPTRRVDA